MRFRVDLFSHRPDETLILEQLLLTNLKLDRIMALIEELNAKVTELQAAVDAEQEQIAALLATNTATVVALTEQIAALEAALASGATADQLTTVIAALEAVKADVEGTV
jgi:hypothetical protein